MSGFLYLRTHSHCHLGVPLGGHLYFSFGLHEVWYMYILPIFVKLKINGSPLDTCICLELLQV